MPERGEVLEQQCAYLSRRLEENARELTRLDLLNLTLTQQRRKARAALHFVRVAQAKAQAATTADALHRGVVETVVKDLGMEGAAVLLANWEERTLRVLATAGAVANLDDTLLPPLVERRNLAAASFANSSSVDGPWRDFLAAWTALPYFAWCPLVEERGGVLAILAGNRTEDLIVRQPLSEDTVEILDSLAGFVRLRLEEIASTQRALGQREQRIRYLAEIVRTSPLAVIATDEEARIEYVSPAAESLYGYSAEELLGKDPAMLNAEPMAAQIQQEILTAIRGGGIWEGELRNRRADGRVIYVRASMYQLLDADGQVLSLVGFLQDITEQKRAEAQLLQVQKLESLGVLAGGIAHDFNNILTGILGNISLTRQYLRIRRPVEEVLDQAEMACGRARELTRQLLTFSKGGAPVRRTICLDQVIRATASFVARGTDVRCECQVEAGLWPVEADEGQIGQVISNLVINAIQAGPRDRTVRVGADNALLEEDGAIPLPAGRYVRLAVADRGPGIPAEVRERLFDPYFTTKRGGSGLGLATAHSIVRQHGGFLEVESEEGVGTTMRLYLPASTGAVEEVSAPELSAAQVAGRVLLMDDEETVRKPAAAMLECLGYRVTASGDGAQAVGLYQEALEAEDRYDAVILDLTVAGGMGGRDCLAALRQLDPTVRAIVCSGYSNDPVMSRFTEYGFAGVLPKPFVPDDLAAAIQGAIRARVGSAVEPSRGRE